MSVLKIQTLKLPMSESLALSRACQTGLGKFIFSSMVVSDWSGAKALVNTQPVAAIRSDEGALIVVLIERWALPHR